MKNYVDPAVAGEIPLKSGKKFFLTLIFAVIMQVALGQIYYPLVDTNKMWSTIILQIGNPINSYFTKFSEDTIIGGENYKKIFNSTDSTLWFHIGFVREDSLKRIYLRDTLDNEGLVYNFDVSIGDTINFYNPFKPYYPYDSTILVDSIYQINIGDILRNAIDVVVSGDPLGYARETWIEGIGNLVGILEGGYLLAGVVGWDYRLLCFYENNILLYHNPIYPSCDYPTNTNDYLDDKTEKEFIIYPNPIYNKFYIESNIRLDIYVEIYNIFGQVIEKLKINTNTNEIYLNNGLGDGLYFCILKDKSSNIIAKTKLIIQKP